MLGGWRKVNRSVLAAIGVPVAITVGSVGTFLLSSPHPSRVTAARHDRAAVHAAPVSSSAPASPTPDRDRRRHKAHKRASHHNKTPARGSVTAQAAPCGSVAGHLFVGVAVPAPLTSSVQSFSAATGAHLALVELYTGFGSPFPQLEASRVTALGSTPLIQWDPDRAPLGNIAAGSYDGYLRQWAAAAKAFGHPMVLSFGHEMNGPWSRWGSAHATPAQFVAAWRRIYTIFASQHTGNVTWSWDPSHTGADPQPWWPGPGYVNEIGIDGYQRPGQTFAQIFAQRLALIRSFARKPIFIAETSVAPSPGQSSQIIGLFNGVIQYGLSGFVWFDINGLEQWQLAGRPAAISTFRACVARTQ